MNQARFTHSIDSVLGDAVKAVASRDPNHTDDLDAAIVQAAKANPVLTRAIAVINQAVNRSADAITQYGAIDAIESRNNAESIASARSMLQSLALALEIGTLIIDRTEASFGNPKLVGDPARDRRRPVEAKDSEILSRPEQRDPDAMRSGNLDESTAPTAPINPPRAAPVPEPGKKLEFPPEEATDFGPDEPPAGATPDWPVVDDQAPRNPAFDQPPASGGDKAKKK